MRDGRPLGPKLKREQNRKVKTPRRDWSPSSRLGCCTLASPSGLVVRRSLLAATNSTPSPQFVRSSAALSFSLPSVRMRTKRSGSSVFDEEGANAKAEMLRLQPARIDRWPNVSSPIHASVGSLGVREWRLHITPLSATNDQLTSPIAMSRQGRGHACCHREWQSFVCPRGDAARSESFKKRVGCSLLFPPATPGSPVAPNLNP